MEPKEQTSADSGMQDIRLKPLPNPEVAFHEIKLPFSRFSCKISLKDFFRTLLEKATVPAKPEIFCVP